MSEALQAAPIEVLGLTSAGAVAEARARARCSATVMRRLYRGAVREGRLDVGSLDLSERVKRALLDGIDLGLPEVTRRVAEEGDVGTTEKAVLRLRDGLPAECVHIPMGRGRHTLCVSSQVGCKMGCRFCETARMGLVRNLSAAEIVGQVLVARHVLGWPVRNVVFMGMGEALDNFEGVTRAIAVLNDPGGLAMAQERLTVCTAGHLEGIRRLAALGFKRLNLSVSLNVADDARRAELMPIGRRHGLGELQGVLASYRPRRNFCLGVNYCLMPGLNDGREDARAVARFCEPIARVLVNVIPYNPGTAPLTRAPTAAEVDAFIGWLREEGLPVRRRITKGGGVMAACGQLGDPELRRRLRVAG